MSIKQRRELKVMVDKNIIRQKDLTKAVNDAKCKPLETTDVRELGSSMTKTYLKDITKAAEDGKKGYAGDFFVVVILRVENAFRNVVRRMSIARQTCPTPDYDQSVWMYNKNKDSLEFLWCIPSKRMCIDLIENMNISDVEHIQLIRNILDFRDGTLFEKAQILNKEDVLIGNALIEVQDGQ